jgi:type VI secretion system protein ImpK
VRGRNLSRVAGDLFGYLLLFQQAPDSHRPDLPALRSHVLGLLETFAKAPEAQAAASGDLEEARFALVAWADEMVLRTSWPGRDQWEREPLQLQLFGTNRAGDEFYDHLARLRPEQTAAREIFFVCLALGFEGGYVGRDAERRGLISQQYEMLRVAGRALDATQEEFLFPTAYDLGIRLPPARSGRLWSVLSLLGAASFVFFGVLWVILRWLATGVPGPAGS